MLCLGREEEGEEGVVVVVVVVGEGEGLAGEEVDQGVVDNRVLLLGLFSGLCLGLLELL